MKIFYEYECDGCGERYDSEKKARKCERKPTRDLIVGVKVGSIVKRYPSFGWFDGDPRWVVNLKEVMGRDDIVVRQPCKESIDKCFAFYYVVTAIDVHEHRWRYHLETRAMSGKQGYRNGYTFGKHHITPDIVENPPAIVVEDAVSLLGHKSKYLLS